MKHPGGRPPSFPPWAPDLALDLREETGLPLRKIADDLGVHPETLRIRCRAHDKTPERPGTGRSPT
jgi:hypothetical protein